jgi:dihydrofolate reductase
VGKVRVNAFTISVDGYGAGSGQDLEHPLGAGGTELHRWMVGTATFRRSHGLEGGTTGPDDDVAAAGFADVGAWILGRNMFGPVRGPWPDDSWRGWWGDDAPYHCEVFVLTHHARPSFELEGGNVFHFVTGGVHEALDAARAAAGGLDVRIGGGVHTVRQYLEARLIDELDLAISPVLLCGGEHLLGGLDLAALGYRLFATAGTAHALNSNYVPASLVGKFSEPSPNIPDMLRGGSVQLIINTPTRGRDPERDGFKLRRMAVEYRVPCLTSVDTAAALVRGLKLKESDGDIIPMGLHDLE